MHRLLTYSLAQSSVSAVDVDEGVNSIIKYRFSSLTKTEYIRLFTVDSVTGWIHVKWTIDYEVHKKVHLTIEAADEGHPSRVSTCVVEILVLDENDHAPEIKFEPAYLTNYALVPENEKPGRAVAVFSVSDQDSGVNGNVTCKLIGSPEPFSNTKRKQGDESSEDISTSLFKLESMNVPFSLM
ncbi:unnamed protein product [Dicrocoelium dendriticum]|nr:unnamed protein product [Dicrocoelium dendriticum]